MHADYQRWLAEQQYAENTQIAQLSRVKKVEEYYGNLKEHYENGTYQDIIDALQYSVSDERSGKKNPSKIKFEGNIRNNLQSYKNAVVRYKKFLEGGVILPPTAQSSQITEVVSSDFLASGDSQHQRFSLERDMQLALRKNIVSLGESLRIIDDGAERAVDSGFIDITCDDGESIVVIELKAGKADSRAIAQILGYMGDIYEEEGGRPVRGILVANDFDKRTKAAARILPTLILKKYAIEFKFSQEA